MPPTLRDEIAIRVAAALASSSAAASEVAERAYAIADALLRQRSRAAEEQLAWAEGESDVLDPRLDAPPHDPCWEVEPRWSRAERARREQRAAERAPLQGPGLAASRPADGDGARKVS